jgi:cytochrome c biogenesis protein CcdA
MAGTPVILAVSAGMVAAANPCGFAMLPAYLSLLVAGQDAGQEADQDAGSGGAPAARVRGVGRALASTIAMTAGFVAVFGAFGLVLTPVAGWLQPRLPWLTLALGVLLAILGCWLLAGRVAALPGVGARAPRLTGSPASMALFGVGYALASLSCTVAPFLAIVVSSLHAGSESEALVLFLAYAAGMGLVVGVTALAVALVRTSLVRRLRRASGAVSRVGGMLILVAGAYVAYYGWYEVRIAADSGIAGRDPVVTAVATVQQGVVALINRAGVELTMGAFAALLIAALALRRPAGSPPVDAAGGPDDGASRRAAYPSPDPDRHRPAVPDRDHPAPYAGAGRAPRVGPDRSAAARAAMGRAAAARDRGHP